MKIHTVIFFGYIADLLILISLKGTAQGLLEDSGTNTKRGLLTTHGILQAVLLLRVLSRVDHHFEALRIYHIAYNNR